MPPESPDGLWHALLKSGTRIAHDMEVKMLYANSNGLNTPYFGQAFNPLQGVGQAFSPLQGGSGQAFNSAARRRRNRQLRGALPSRSIHC